MIIEFIFLIAQVVAKVMQFDTASQNIIIRDDVSWYILTRQMDR